MKKRKAKGVFFVFEGIDGSGKSTQVKKLYRWFGNQGMDALLTCEPTEKKTGKKIREALIQGDISQDELCRLFLEDRKEHCENDILPGINQGIHVLCDRYIYSHIAYQGAMGFDMHSLKTANQSFPVPDLVFYLKIEVDTALQRIGRRGEKHSIFEKKTFLSKVKETFDSFSFENYICINAEMDEDKIFEVILQNVEKYL